MSIHDKLHNVQEKVPLAPYTTFRIGGPARYFFVAKSSEDLVKAVRAARAANIRYFILGGGANVLVSDEGFDGLAIKLQATSYKLQATKIWAEAGVRLGEIVRASVEAGLTGLEWAAGIPGTVGGAVRGNAGAFGKCMADVVKKIEALNYESGIKNYELSDLKFGYRDSIFKHNNDIILSVELKLQKGNKEESQKTIEEYLKKRKERQPSEYPSAGSIFKNIPLKDVDKEKFKKGLDISEEEFIASTQFNFFPAGRIIEALGLKTKKIGMAMVSEKHANIIVNIGQAKASDVIMLISLIKLKVRDAINVQLEEEIQLVGF